MRVRYLAVMCAVWLPLSAAPASAQWFVSPAIGASFGGDANDSRMNVGVAAGFMSDQVIGFEVALDVTPGILDSGADDLNLGLDIDGNVTTVMFNGMAVAPRWMGARPYGTAGVGWIQSGINDANNVIDVSNSDFGFNLGGGLTGNFNDNVGWRGDIRYLRSLAGSDGLSLDIDSDGDLDTDLGIGGDLSFYRSTFGVTFTW